MINLCLVLVFLSLLFLNFQLINIAGQKVSGGIQDKMAVGPTKKATEESFGDGSKKVAEQTNKAKKVKDEIDLNDNAHDYLSRDFLIAFDDAAAFLSRDF